MKKIFILLLLSATLKYDTLYRYNNKVVIDGRIIEVEKEQSKIMIDNIEYKIVN